MIVPRTCTYVGIPTKLSLDEQYTTVVMYSIADILTQGSLSTAYKVIRYQCQHSYEPLQHHYVHMYVSAPCALV